MVILHQSSLRIQENSWFNSGLKFLEKVVYFSGFRSVFSLSGVSLIMSGVSHVCKTYEPRHENTGFLPMRKQRRRSASQ